MLGNIRERSIKNNKLVYVHAKIPAPELEKKKYPISKQSNQCNYNNIHVTSGEIDEKSKKFE